jgi:hypothetical protein
MPEISIPVVFHQACTVGRLQVGQWPGGTPVIQGTSILEAGRHRGKVEDLSRIKEMLAGILQTCCRICFSKFRAVVEFRHSRTSRPVHRCFKLSARTRSLFKR